MCQRCAKIWDYYLQRSCPSDYIRHIHHAFIIIFETRHTGLIMASLNALFKLLPSSPFRLSPCLFIGVHRFLSASCFYFHLLSFLGYARSKYNLVLQPRFNRLPRVRHSVRPQKTTSGLCCSIPFTYKGVTYNSCTDAGHHRLWCSLDSQYKGRWENCCKFLINWPDQSLT